MAPKSVVAVILAHPSIAGAFHFSINEDVPGEQGHFGTHVNPIHNLSNVVILRLPCRDNTGGFSVTGYNNVNYSTKKNPKHISGKFPSFMINGDKRPLRCALRTM